MEKVKGADAQKQEDFKTSFINIVKMLNLFTTEELERIDKACEDQGNYTGLINQSFGSMAKRFKQMHEREDEIYGTALTILPSLAGSVVEGDNVAADIVRNFSKEAVVKKSIDLAKEFIKQVKEESEK